MSIAKYITGSMVVASLFLSCTKTKSYDITGDAEVKFFTNNLNAGNTPQNSISFSAVNIPNTAGSGLLNLSSTIPGTIKFPVFASRPVSEDVVIGAVLDTSLVAVYNASHNTNYAAFPAGFFKTDSLFAHINKDASISSDSMIVTSNLSVLNTLTGTDYMAPIKLTTVSKAGVGGISSTTQVTYLVANVEQRRIRYLAVAADALGALLTNRTAWVSTFTPAPSTTGSIFDGSLTTFTRWSASPGQVDVNMQTAANVTGIRLYTANSATQVPTQVDVYLSNDGITYDRIGFPLKANITYASTYNYILFYKAIPAKYIRLMLYYTTSTNTQNFRVTEFDVYAN